jgi:hypothetical protein
MFHAMRLDYLWLRNRADPPEQVNAALIALLVLATSSGGRPMITASPQTAQPHSWQSPSAASGQPAGSAWNCSNSRSCSQLLQYLLRCIILVASSLRRIKGLEGSNGVDADSGTLLR